MRRGRRPADAEHPLGYGGDRFLWAFLAAISSFLIGGCLTIGLAITAERRVPLHSPGEEGNVRSVVGPDARVSRLTQDGY